MKNKKNEKNKVSQLTVVGHSGYNIVSTSLPSNFFEGLLIMEMELNNEFSMEKLLALVSQYSLAIEFYLQTDPMKAKAYQNRMEYLLTNKDTLVALSRIKSGKKDENENEQKIKKNKDSNKTKQYVKFQQEGLKEEDIFKRVNTVLNQGNTKIEEKKNVKSLINDDIKKQDESWKEKLQIKKKKTLKNSAKPSPHMKKRMSNDKSMEINKNFSVDNIPKKDEIKNNIINIRKSNESLKENKEEEKIEKDQKVEEVKEDKVEEKKEEEKNVEEKNAEEKKEEKKEDEKKEDKIVGDENEEGNKVEEKKEEEIKNEDKVEEKKEEEVKKDEEKKEEKKDEENKEEENKEINEKKDEEIEVNENKEENNQGDLESIINKLMKEQEDEEKKDEEKKDEEEDKKDEDEEDLIFNKIVESNPEPKDLQPVMARKSIVDEDVTRKIEPDEEIKKPIDEQIQSLKNIILNLNKIKSKKENNNENDDDDDEEDEDSQNEENNKNSEHSNSNQNLNKIVEKDGKGQPGHGLVDSNVDKIPAKFRSTYYQVESLMIDYMNNFNEFFYQDVFEQFSSGLKELYELKYKKYIEIRNEYHNQIKENEYLLENDENLNEEKKLEIQQTIDSLNEEQQHQIATVEDEFNRKIMDKISEFKLNSFKTNSGIQLLEEQIKLDIYSLINDSFY